MATLPILLCDFYKLSHREQYPKDTAIVYSTWTPRKSRLKGIEKVVCFGVQSFIKKYLIEYFNENFFNRDFVKIETEYKRFMKHTLGVEADVQHLKELHDLRYLPLEIKALEEGVLAPIRTPMVTVKNTDSRFYWLTNFIETMMSAMLWQPMTSATIAFEYKKILTKWANKTGASLDSVMFQAHDFSMRGMSSIETAELSGAGHLLSFYGTDTIPAISFLEEYYNANIEKEIVGTSISATEHSVMCANISSIVIELEKNGEYNGIKLENHKDKDIKAVAELCFFKDLLTKIYPDGLFSVVSDTYDFWEVVDFVLPTLKQEVLNRKGKTVIRPDSGNPIDIICGTSEVFGEGSTSEEKGLIESLWGIFGGTINEKGYKVLDSHIGAIYGDSITLERADEILRKLEQKGFSSENLAMGVGSFSYAYNTRDSLGFAMKATYMRKTDGEEIMLYKDPKTDDGTKKSQRGRVVVIEDSSGQIKHLDGLNSRNIVEFDDILQTVFWDGLALNDKSLSSIREKLNKQLDGEINA